jgi:hypothetical protein
MERTARGAGRKAATEQKLDPKGQEGRDRTERGEGETSDKRGKKRGNLAWGTQTRKERDKRKGKQSSHDSSDLAADLMTVK